MRKQSNAVIAVVFVALAFASPARAQAPAEFYKGKNVELYIGYSVGGGYDLYARMLARHMGKHIPGNPTVVPKNMEGAGSLRLANWLYRVAPKDGSVFGIIGRGTGFDPLLGNKAAQFDGPKYTWIGSANNEVSICVAWHTSGVTKFEDLLTRELVVGGTSASADTDQFPKIVNGVLGTKMRVVTGYPGGNEVGLAMERGEVQGRCGWSWSSVKSTHQQWYDQKKFAVLVQLALAKHPDLPDVPLVVDLAKTDEAPADPQADLRAPGDGPAVPGAARYSAAIAPRRCARRSSTRSPTRSSWPIPTRRSWRSTRCRRGDPAAGDGDLPDAAGRRAEGQRPA